MQDELTRLCHQIRSARADGQAVLVRGGDTKRFYGEDITHLSDNASVLDMTRYRGIINYEPSELVITARAGTPLAEIEQVIAGEGQMLAFEPPRFGAGATLGGCVAAGLSGPRRIAAGRINDFVLGVRLLDSTGQVLAFGGEVMKNVAGYDVSRLLVGSLGSLGAIAEVSVKVLPVPVSEETVCLELDEDSALAHFSQWRSQPLPISATAWLAGDPATSPAQRLYVRVSGSEPAVRSALNTIGGERLPSDEGDAFWRSLRDQTHPFFLNRPLWRVAVPPTSPALGLGPGLIEWNGGLRWVSGEPAMAQARARAQELGGHATLYRHDDKPLDVPVFHPMPAVLRRINQRMMEQMDPAGIFAPGRQRLLNKDYWNAD